MRLSNILVSLSLLVALIPRAAGALENRVDVGEASTRVRAKGIDLPTMLKEAMRQEISLVDLSHAKTSAIVSATILRLERSGRSTTCEVSAALRTRSGKLVAVLSGRARAENGNHLREALGGAVHGAFQRMGDALGD